MRLETRIDDPEGCLVPGTIVPTGPTYAGPLTVSRLHFDGSRWFAAFKQAHDRTAAEALRGMKLLVEINDNQDDKGHDENHEIFEETWYRHELVGLRALSASGEELGEVTDVKSDVIQDRFVVTTSEGDDVAAPFVEALVSAINPEAGTVTLAPPGGLFPGYGQTEEIR